MRKRSHFIKALAGSVLAAFAAVPSAAQAQAAATTPVLTTAANTHLAQAQQECLFRWAQDRVPKFLRSQDPKTQRTAQLNFRFYEKTNTYLGVSNADKHLYFYAPDMGKDALKDLGPAADWLANTGCATPYEPIKTEFDEVGVAPICSPEDPGQNCVETHHKAVRMDDELALSFARTEFDATTHIFRAELKAGAELDPRLEVGAYLHRSRKDRSPLLHRIDSLIQKGQVVTMQLSKAQGKDVFPRGRIKTRIPLADPSLKATPSASGLSPRLSTPPFGISDCSGNVFDTPFGAINSAGVQVAGNVKFDLTKCHFLLQAWVDASLDWDVAALDVDKVEVSVGGGVDAELDTKLVIDVNAAYATSKRIWQLPTPIVVPVGPIVLSVTPEINAGFSVSGKANLTALAGFKWTDEITVGLGYNDVNKWYPINQRNNTFTHYGPTATFEGNVTARPWLELQTNVTAFGLLGGSVSLEGFAEATLTGTASTTAAGAVTGEVCAALDVGLVPRAGVVVELFGADIWGQDWALATFTLPVVKKTCTPAAKAPTIPSDAASNSQCFTDSQCTQPTDPTISASCVKGEKNLSGANAGTYTYVCKTTYPANYCPYGSSTADALCAANAAPRTPKSLIPVCNASSHRCETPDVEVPPASTATTPAGSTPIFDAAATCKAPGCCYVNSDCADGNAATIDTCEKTSALKGPSVKGVCASTVKQGTALVGK